LLESEQELPHEEHTPAELALKPVMQEPQSVPVYPEAHGLPSPPGHLVVGDAQAVGIVFMIIIINFKNNKIN